jgi:hypothetical protein
MDENTCEICGGLASVHITEIRNGQQAERHLCAEHAELSDITGLPAGQVIVNGVSCSGVEAGVARGMMRTLHAVANFARRHGGMPVSDDELREGMALQDDVTGVEITDPEVRDKLKYVDGLIAFCQSHGRMPRTPEEMPPAR